MDIERIFTVYTVDTEQNELLNMLLKALKIKYEVSAGNSCEKEFIGNMVLQNEDEIKKGKGKKSVPKRFENLWE